VPIVSRVGIVKDILLLLLVFLRTFILIVMSKMNRQKTQLIYPLVLYERIHKDSNTLKVNLENGKTTKIS
jgi:hypothetical protein